MASSKIRLYGSTSGYVELEAPAVAPDASLVLPSTFAGVGSNVVQTVKTDTFSTSSGTFTAITGLTVTITPSSTTSKILLIASIAMSDSSAASGGVQVRFTGGNAANYIGDAASNRTQAASAVNTGAGSDMVPNSFTQSLVYLDSPATGSAVTYAVEMRTSTGPAHINRSRSDTDSSAFARVPSGITAIEVAA
jgi:hypothetical protein